MAEEPSADLRPAAAAPADRGPAEAAGEGVRASPPPEEASSADSIPLIPVIPEPLREAAESGRLVPFVGAGLSRLAGCPGWDGFANRVVEQLRRAGQIDCADADHLARTPPRTRLSIALALARDATVEIDYADALNRGAGSTPEPDGAHAYEHLSEIADTFVTTNYDQLLDLLPRGPASGGSGAPDSKRTAFHNPSDFTFEALDGGGAVFHLHGSLANPAGMVVTTNDYLRHYANDRRGAGENPILTFLDDLFRLRTVLFLGYGLEELEILELLLNKARGGRNREWTQTHFILQGFFSHELRRANLMRRYYRDLGVHLLPFRTDFNGHSQIVAVLERYATQLGPADAEAAALRSLIDAPALLEDDD